MSEPTLTDIAQQLTDFRTDTQHRLDVIDKRLDVIDKRLEKLDIIEKRLDTLDGRFFEFSMRMVTTNQSAFWSISIALLSAVIAFVVARISGGTL